MLLKHAHCAVVQQQSYTPQSGNVGVTETVADSSTSAQVTTFADQTAGFKTDINSGYDSTMDLANNGDSDLGNFLSRPIKIATYSWAVAGPLFEQFNPWTEFCTNTYVKEKLGHYELLRCNMNYKILVSGTGFHYGRALVSYNPYVGYDEVSTQRAFLEIDLVAASQKPCFYINPTLNEGGEMKCPFFYHNNYMSLSNGDWTDMGEVSIKSMTNLEHANGGDDVVTLTVFAWATETVLVMPTSQFAGQSGKRPKMNSGDEYGKGIISGPASAIAKAAGALVDAPMIGPYARATQICAQAIGDVSAHFGYSRPAIISDTVLQKPTVTGNLCNTDAAEAVNRLTLDSKQELTVDSRTVGLDGADQMTIKSLVTRESYLTQFSYDTTSALDSLLWTSRVGPTLYRGNGTTEIHPTPMSMTSAMFDKWQGTIKFRFQIVKSAFHKGRLLFRWDPQAHGAPINYNTVYSRVVDIAEEEDFEIEIGWGQALPFLDVKPMTIINTDKFGTTRFLKDTTDSWNGVLECIVLNTLVSPAADKNLKINVFVSACDDLKLGGPSDHALQHFSLFAQQSGSRYVPQSAMAELALTSPTSPDSSVTKISSTLGEVDHQMEVFFGESITSLRQLFRRYTLSKVWITETPTSGNLRLSTLTLKGLPYNYGDDLQGIETNGAGATRGNFTSTCPLSFMMPCYAGWRGSVRKKYMFDGNVGTSPIVTRSGYKAHAVANTDFNISDEALLQRSLAMSYGTKTFGGASTTHTSQNAVLEIEIPYYNGGRMSTARDPSSDYLNGVESVTIEHMLYPNGSRAFGGTSSYIHDWSSVGEDFSLFFFVGCPILYKYATVPSAAP
jgi:hypothetical protein